MWEFRRVKIWDTYYEQLLCLNEKYLTIVTTRKGEGVGYPIFLKQYCFILYSYRIQCILNIISIHVLLSIKLPLFSLLESLELCASLFEPIEPMLLMCEQESV